jgi:lycopene beta-cyclase
VTTDVRYAIAGAGCAGLSLACAMLEARVPGRAIAIVDPRTTFDDDRTWCSFAVAPHAFSDVASHRWHRWRIAAERDAVVESPIAYEHVSGRAFYDRALARCREAGVELLLGTSVRELWDRGDRVFVETDERSLVAEHVFDSRPHPPADDGEPFLLQHFVGWFVETERAAFDPTVATLMDFRVAQDAGIHFVYVLPFSDTYALVEDTYFSPAILAAADYERTLAEYLRPLSPYRIVRTERGAIPMTTRRLERRPSRRVLRIGVGGGLARPSTGYAFAAIQRDSAMIAAAIASGSLDRVALERPKATRFLDRVFLRQLAAHPERAPALFERLFARTAPDALARFLGEAASLEDNLAVMRALPARELAPRALRMTLLRF